MQGPVQTIPQAFSSLKRQGFIRQFDAAQRLNLSEGELIAAHINRDIFLHAFSQPDLSAVDVNGPQTKSECTEIFAADELSDQGLAALGHRMGACGPSSTGLPGSLCGGPLRSV